MRARGKCQPSDIVSLPGPGAPALARGGNEVSLIVMGADLEAIHYNGLGVSV